MSNVMNILKQKHHPEQYKAEQAEAADKLHAERLESIEELKKFVMDHGLERFFFKKQ